MQNPRLPQHFRFIIPIIEVLKELGGYGRSSEVTDLAVENLNISEEGSSTNYKKWSSKNNQSNSLGKIVFGKDGLLGFFSKRGLEPH